jgi:hypothetical protein
VEDFLLRGVGRKGLRVKALNHQIGRILKQEAYAKAASDVDPGKTTNERAMMRLLEYRLYEDLRRWWRVIQPNLEQCGLLGIEYPGLKNCAAMIHS